MPLRVGIPHQPYSFLIKKLDGLIVAQDDEGRIRFSDEDAAKVVQQALEHRGRIFLKKATYNLTSRLRLYSDTLLEGEGWGTVLYDHSIPSDNSILYGFEASNIMVKNLKLLGRSGSENDLITFTGGMEKLTFKNLYLSQPADEECMAFYDQVNDLQVEGCFFEHPGAQSAIENRCITQRSYRIKILGNIFLDCLGGGVTLYNPREIEICNNIFMSSYAPAVTISNEALPGDKVTHDVQNIIISDNIIRGVQRGVFLAAPDAAKIAFGVVKNNVIFSPTQHGIHLTEYNHRIGVKDNIIVDVPSGYSGLEIEGTDCNILDNQVYGLGRGVTLRGDGQVVVGNDLRYIATKVSIVSGVHDIRLNPGYVTENSGAATIAAGNTYIDIPHGLDILPDINKIDVTPQSDTGGKRWWVTAHPTAPETYFRIYIDSAHTADITFGWSYN